MTALDSFHEEFGWCTLCKTWGKILVKVIEEYAKQVQVLIH